MEHGRLRKVFIFGLFLALTATGGYFLYQQHPSGLPAGFASGNGRLEATEVDVATKIAGRLAELGPREGDIVAAGAVVARLDVDDLRAQLRAAEAQVEQELAAKPMYQIALDHGIAQADLPTFMAEIHKTAFAAAVKDGVMTQAQADAMLQRMSQNGYCVNCPMGGGGYGNGRGNGMMGGGRWQTQGQ